MIKSKLKIRFNFLLFLPIVLVIFTSSCSFSIGKTTFRDDLINSNKDGSSYNFDLSIPSGSTDKPKWIVSAGWQDFRGITDLSLTEIDITRRFWLDNIWSMKPYVGAGLGYFKFTSETSYSTCPSGYICWGDWTETDIKTIASGYNPHILIGIEKSLSRQFSLILEDKYEISKEDNQLDFSSNTLSFGIKMKF